MKILTKLVAEKGLQTVAKSCGVTYQAVRKWESSGLPRTEFTGETDHAAALAGLVGGSQAEQSRLRFQLLEETRAFLLGRRQQRVAADPHSAAA